MNAVILVTEQMKRAVRSERPEIDPTTYGNLVYDKGSILNHWGKDGLFSKWCWDNWLTVWEKIKITYTIYKMKLGPGVQMWTMKPHNNQKKTWINLSGSYNLGIGRSYLSLTI